MRHFLGNEHFLKVILDLFFFLILACSFKCNAITITVKNTVFQLNVLEDKELAKYFR